tara:strand:+ start:442 stop:828 length:387 start_codon:yes stop_codon:yes gene_type:complete
MDRLFETLKNCLMFIAITIDKKIEGIITIKPFKPYNKISDMLNLIPKKIIPSLSRYLIENSNPGLYFCIKGIVFPIKAPRIIVIIIGETGLLSRPNIFVPMKTDMLSDKREVSMHIIMPINVFFIIYT